VDGDLQLHLAQQVDGDLVAAINLRVPLLPAEALHVHHGQAEHLHLGERGFDRFEPSGLDDGDDQFHVWVSGSGCPTVNLVAAVAPLKGNGGQPSSWRLPDFATTSPLGRGLWLGIIHVCVCRFWTNANWTTPLERLA